jgi:hypothetical protein
MKNLKFADLVAVLQTAFEDEDLFDCIEDDDSLATEMDINLDNPLAYYLINKIYNSYEKDVDNEEKLDAFYTVIEDTRGILNCLENNLNNWEEFVDGSESDYD